MRALRASLRPAAGIFVIAHGLAHAVLPLRGWMDPSRLALDLMPLILYTVSVVGFVIAGLGLLAVRPFASIVRPAMVLASAYSLIALFTFGQKGLAWAVAIDLALLLTAFAALYRFLPSPPQTSRGMIGKLTALAGIAFVIYCTIAVVSWPLHRRWGSLPAEHALALPGDPAERNPALELQHAVTIDTAPDAVWAWLVQLGQDRAGFYSYDWLERAFGVDVHNVFEIRPEWQSRRIGDHVPATQDNYCWGILGDGIGWTVTDVQPNRAMVLRYWGAFVLEPTLDGKTRFIVRTRVGSHSIAAWMAPIDMAAFELPHFIMERRMMLRIKSLAESGRSL